MKHSFKQRIIYADTDAEGMVYYANYLRFFERGRMELLREMGISILDLKEKQGILFAKITAVAINAKSFKPAKLPQKLFGPKTS